MIYKVITPILFLTSFLSFSQDTCLTNLSLGISFPPVADNAQRDFAKTHLDILGVTKIRIAEDWSLREPTQGNFNWAPLDERINWATTNNYKVLLTIQSKAPSWACSIIQNPQSCVFSDNNDFKIYVDSLLQRYPNQIYKIQFGNEWQSDFWYAGNASEFIDANNILYNSVQMYSPNTKVVLGGFTTISLRFMAGCNGLVSQFYNDEGDFFDQNYLDTNCFTPLVQDIKSRIDSVLIYAKYDELDLHLYDDVEQWDEYYLNFADTITKPIIVSEFGGPNLNYEGYSESYQADRLYQYIKKLDSLNVSEAYYFKLVEGTANPSHAASGLISDTTLQEKSAYYLFQSFLGCTTYLYEYNYGKSIKFYPNPMHNITTVEFENNHPDSIKSLTIYSADGEVVREVFNISKNYVQIKRENLKSGYYYIKIRDNSGVIARGKLIIY